jgi:hypothetical protein
MQTNDSLIFLQLRDVGVQSGSVYAVNYFPQPYDPSIRISHDYGHTFSIQQVDSVFHDLSRGAVNNELYIIRMEYDTTEYYHIYQSFDEGMTLIPRGTIPASISWFVSLQQDGPLVNFMLYVPNSMVFQPIYALIIVQIQQRLFQQIAIIFQISYQLMIFIQTIILINSLETFC